MNVMPTEDNVELTAFVHNAMVCYQRACVLAVQLGHSYVFVVKHVSNEQTSYR